VTTTQAVRVALWISVPLNLLGTALFGAAALGRPPATLPIVPPPFYAAQVGLTIAIFAGVYGWLARQAQINRPLLMVGGLGTLGFFGVCAAYAIAGDLPWQSVMQASPDLALGTIFLWWLAATRR
jgi:hypothetical protein